MFGMLNIYNVMYIHSACNTLSLSLSPSLSQSQSSENYSYPVVAMAVTKDTLLASFKAAVLSKINLLSVEGTSD